MEGNLQTLGKKRNPQIAKKEDSFHSQKTPLKIQPIYKS